MKSFDILRAISIFSNPDDNTLRDIHAGKLRDTVCELPFYRKHGREASTFEELHGEDIVKTAQVIEFNAGSILRTRRLPSLFDWRFDHSHSKKSHATNPPSVLTKELSKKNASGSVSELAEKFGVSKSEIRRMRAAGTLDEFINSKS